ncbi:hypothetical protein DGM85_20880 [Xanthomonas phaseoli pv. phaseoli]|nr:hypothetical protein DGM93_20615 [Xanthomonas phaseoli pv. phaseoli]QWN30566.1 hypothetical protein DGM85_20880 [Xanthomonas phaseoli pv. phaseoli]QWN34684.1 hypothetical protein DGM81_20375 [Xanthomonas phaseoli pv. phaseoli]
MEPTDRFRKRRGRQAIVEGKLGAAAGRCTADCLCYVLQHLPRRIPLPVVQVVAGSDPLCHRQVLRKPLVDVVVDTARWCRRDTRKCSRLARRTQR